MREILAVKDCFLTIEHMTVSQCYLVLQILIMLYDFFKLLILSLAMIRNQNAKFIKKDKMMKFCPSLQEFNDACEKPFGIRRCSPM